MEMEWVSYISLCILLNPVEISMNGKLVHFVVVVVAVVQEFQ